MKLELETEAWVRTLVNRTQVRRDVLRELLTTEIGDAARGRLERDLEALDALESDECELRYSNVDEESQEHDVYETQGGEIVMGQLCGRCEEWAPCRCETEYQRYIDREAEGTWPDEEPVPPEPDYRDAPVVRERGQAVTVPVRLVLHDPGHVGFAEAELWIGREPEVVQAARGLRRAIAEERLTCTGEDAAETMRLLGAILEELEMPVVVSGGWNNNLRRMLTPAFAWGERDAGGSDDAGALGAGGL